MAEPEMVTIYSDGQKGATVVHGRLSPEQETDLAGVILARKKLDEDALAIQMITAQDGCEPRQGKHVTYALDSKTHLFARRG